MKSIQISRLGPLNNIAIDLPASKSISNRLLILNALSNDKIDIKNLSTAGDTALLVSLLRKITLHQQSGNTIEPCVLNACNTGTAFRFLTAFLSIQPGSWLLTGSERMQQRPVRSLIDALKQLGVNIEYTAKDGYPPLLIRGGLIEGGEVVIDMSESSQFASSLMLIAPFLPLGLTLRFSSSVASMPYIEMTAGLLRLVGVSVNLHSNAVHIKSQSVKKVSIPVESDWSAASYWFEIVSLSKQSGVFLRNLLIPSLQGDCKMSSLFNNLSVEVQLVNDGIILEPAKTLPRQSELHFDFTHHPDLAPAIAATCTALNQPAILSGMANLRIKECDRLQALRQELSKINPAIHVDEHENLVIPACAQGVFPQNIRFQSYGDHRIAMAMAPLALICGSVTIEGPEVINKSYPEFWNHLSAAGFDIRYF